MTVRIEIPSERIADFCERWQVAKLALFGSVLRDDFGPDSDIDALARFDDTARRTLFDVGRMEEELSEIFGRDVDLVSWRGVESSRNYIRRRAILDAAETIYAPKQSIRRDEALLLDMLLAARDAVDFARVLTFESFAQDRMVQHAILQAVETVGRAAFRVSAETRDAHSRIPWTDIVEMQHCFKDDHFNIDLTRVWETVNEDIPRLISHLERLVPPESEV
ncbi:MAG: nucleotidyltransferase domain-containing protein [Rhodospirillaceae bacterium]|nr:nucleotidyltransferase domain-containing protein [Rhodospirillaceae bacterium]